MRTDIIRDRVVDLFQATLGCRVVLANQSGWEQVNNQLRFRFGYMPPILPHDDKPATVLFSPDLIARVTAWLDDDQFDMYMTTIEALVVAHLEHEDLSPDAVMLLIEDQLTAVAPLSLALVIEVEMRAMDSGIVSSK